uniref:Uncharacterized protein n=1 Tax=Parascaris equorum TaxID=6256 RepID=A0A914SAD4_PAREQ
MIKVFTIQVVPKTYSTQSLFNVTYSEGDLKERHISGWTEQRDLRRKKLQERPSCPLFNRNRHLTETIVMPNFNWCDF